MKFIFCFIVLNSLFNSYHFLSEKLDAVYFTYTYNLIIPIDDKYVKSKLVEIFSIDSSIDVSYRNYAYNGVLQSSFVLPNIQNEVIAIRSSQYYAGIWYRILNASAIVPQTDFNSKNLKMKITKDKNSFNVISWPESFNVFTVNYDLWVVPIIPNGIFKAWPGEKTFKSEIRAAIDSSYNQDGLSQNGINIGSKMMKSNYSWHAPIANRGKYTYLIIVRAYLFEGISVQYPPIIIYGCLSSSVFSSLDAGNGSNVMSYNYDCKSMEGGTPPYIVLCCFLGFGILYILCGPFWESLQIFFTQWIFMIYVGCLVCQITIMSLTDLGNSLYSLVFGAALAIAILLSLFVRYCCNKSIHFQIFFTILCILVIQYSVMWFSFQYVPVSSMIRCIIVGIISIIVFIILWIFKDFTYTFGTMIIGFCITCCGFPMVLLSSSNGYLLMDFFNFLSSGFQDINYFSLFSFNDLIALILWFALIIVIGSITFRIRRRRKPEVTTNTSTNIELQSPNNNNDYGATTTNHVTVIQRFTEIQIPPSSRAVQPSAPRFSDNPPSYNQIMNL